MIKTLFSSFVQTLSNSPQRQHSPDPRSLWLFVDTPSAFGTELAYRLYLAQPSLMDATRYTIICNILLLYIFVYYVLMTSPLWLAIGPQSL